MFLAALTTAPRRAPRVETVTREGTGDWYLREWMRELGKRQADLTRDLGWLKGRASKVVNSKQPYTKELVIELSTWLGIRPFELLMRPDEAIGLRRLRDTAIAIAAGAATSPPSEPQR